MHRIVCIVVCLLGVTGCVDREQAAKRLLNDALAAWQSDNFEVAEAGFERIQQRYLATAVATEANSARELLIEKYKADNHPALMKLNNRGFFSSQVMREIDRYYQIIGVYPATLTVIDFPQREVHLQYLSLCDYQPTFFEYGFRLDCQAADIEFAKKYPSIERRHHYPYRTLTANPSKPMQSFLHATIYQLNDFPQAYKTWGEHLNPEGVIPPSGFSATYINTGRPDQIMAQETVSHIGIRYAWDSFHHINSDDFGAYWVGRLELTQDTTKILTLRQSWSNARVIIDNHIVYEGNGQPALLLRLKEGTHIVEVEYTNNWHTTDFSMALLDTVQELSLEDSKPRLANTEADASH